MCPSQPSRATERACDEQTRLASTRTEDMPFSLRRRDEREKRESQNVQVNRRPCKTPPLSFAPMLRHPITDRRNATNQTPSYAMETDALREAHPGRQNPSQWRDQTARARQMKPGNPNAQAKKSPSDQYTPCQPRCGPGARVAAQDVGVQRQEGRNQSTAPMTQRKRPTQFSLLLASVLQSSTAQRTLRASRWKRADEFLALSLRPS